MFTKIVSGGQTGVDRAALDVALELGLDCGGWCPPGRTAEDGAIPGRYPLLETPTDTDPGFPDVPHSQRTAWNVRDSDGTLVLLAAQAAPPMSSAEKGTSRLVTHVLTPGAPDRGTALTVELAARHRRPCLVVGLGAAPDVEEVRSWARDNRVGTLNVAGPRESSAPGVYARAAEFLGRLLA